MPLDDATYVENDIIPDILARARELVVKYWIQMPCPPGEGYCIIGSVGSTILAMERETGRPLRGLFDAILDRLSSGLPSCTKTGDLCLEQYNDEPGRTVEDILNLFDKAMVGNEMPL